MIALGSGEVPRPTDVPEWRYDVPVAVVGDLHGRADLLAALLARLPADMPILVMGDLCDRGPDTRGVLDLLVARGAVGVRGNHDEWFLAWVNGDGFDRYALAPIMGGEATLRSYGVVGRSTSEVDAQRWRVPEAHGAFLSALPVAAGLHVCGVAYWLVHAGVPSTEDMTGLSADQVVPHLAKHKPASLLWAKNDPEDMLPVDRTVVMGHLIQRRPLDAGYVIAVDTGAGTIPTGTLTAVVLPERRFVTVG